MIAQPQHFSVSALFVIDPAIRPDNTYQWPDCQTFDCSIRSQNTIIKWCVDEGVHKRAEKAARLPI